MFHYINPFWYSHFGKDRFWDGDDGDLQLSLFSAFPWAGLTFVSSVHVCFPGREMPELSCHPCPAMLPALLASYLLTPAWLTVELLPNPNLHSLQVNIPLK